VVKEPWFNSDADIPRRTRIIYRLTWCIVWLDRVPLRVAWWLERNIRGTR